MTADPDALTISEVVAGWHKTDANGRTGSVVSKTVRRDIDRGLFPGARREPSGWLVPVSDLVASDVYSPVGTVSGPASDLLTADERTAHAVVVAQMKAAAASVADDLDRVTRERDRARSDAEAEATRAHRAELDATEAKARADERAAALDRETNRADGLADDLAEVRAQMAEAAEQTARLRAELAATRAVVPARRLRRLDTTD